MNNNKSNKTPSLAGNTNRTQINESAPLTRDQAANMNRTAPDGQFLPGSREGQDNTHSKSKGSVLEGVESVDLESH